MSISEQIFLQRLESSPAVLKDYINTVYSNEKYLAFVNKHRETLRDKESRADMIRAEACQFLLNIKTLEQFIDDLVDILNMQSFEIEGTVADFFKLCVPEEIQRLIDREAAEAGGTSTKTQPSDTEPISHLDVLSEIENPTPSISTTATFQKSTKAAPQQVSAQTNTAKIPTAQTSANPSLHSPEPIPAYSNPALNIASKLNQKLSEPSASIPKDVYISKKPDPYHEPIA